MNSNKSILWKTICLLIIISLTLSGCGIGGEKNPASDQLTQIGLITGESGIDDPQYQKIWQGMQKAEKDFKIGINYVKAKNDKDYASKISELSKKDCKLIITSGQNAVSAVLEAAKKNPKIKYICLDSVLSNEQILPNVLGISYKVEEAAFLAGYLSGKMTSSRVVGYISGDNKDVSLKYYYGFKAGLRLANSGCELMKGIAGTFTNKSRVEKMAERMVECNADIIFHVAGTAGKSAIKVMEKANKYSIGSVVDQNNIAPESVITSVITKNDEIIYALIEQFKDKTLILGKNSQYGLAENGVGLAETTKNMITEEIYNRLGEQQERIIAGELIIPSTETDYLKFTDN